MTTQELRTPQELYLDWEHDHWAAQDVDLSRDVEQWASLSEAERAIIYYVLSSLMVGEERISTQFAGLVLAQEDEEEGSFLSSQLVDENRHMQFYARYQDEVVANPAKIGEHVARARQELSEPFAAIFDDALVKAHDRLRLDPSDLPAKVDFVTIYHMVLEGTIGITTSYFLLGFLDERELLPGFAEGYGRIARDEQRHIAYGTGFLKRTVARDPALGEVVRERLRTLLPAAAQLLTPPSDGSFDALGVDAVALAEHGFGALTRRLKIIGVSL
jgi:ribonucleoside-diphosphate reductase beta chain